MPLNWRVWCVGVCLPMCGLLRILVDVLCWCVRPSNVRSRSGQPCSPFEAGALPVLRPARRIHIRLRGRVLCNPPRLKGFRSAGGGEASRAWHLWSSSARCSGARPLSRSLRRRSRRLRGDTRRNASSPGYRLLALRRVSPRIRRTASAHVAQFGTRPLVPCLTFHEGAFVFVALALAAVPLARLTVWGCRAFAD